MKTPSNPSNEQYNWNWSTVNIMESALSLSSCTVTCQSRLQIESFIKHPALWLQLTDRKEVKKHSKMNID